jgi:hypothetical protein
MRSPNVACTLIAKLITKADKNILFILSPFHLLQIVLEGLVVFRTWSELAINETDEFDSSTETKLLVAGTVDILIEPIPEAVFLKIETRNELIIAAQGNFILQFHTVDNGIDALFVELGETDAETTEEEVSGMLGIVQVVGIVHDAFDVALIIAYLHTGFENVFHFEICNLQRTIGLKD